MEKQDEKREVEDEGKFFSCAFCHSDSPKPFKICESCGSAQPEPESEEE
jgi:hypothetical protein